MKIKWFLPVLFLVTGCGHNMYTESDVIGFHISVPVGSSWLGVTVGQSKQIVATIRGGASFETTSTSGGGLIAGAGGISKVTQFKTNAQLNEGNVTEIMMSPNVDSETKQTLAKVFMPAANAPDMSPTTLQTRDAAVNTGSESVTNGPFVFQPTGIDKVVTAAVEPVNKVTEGVSENLKEISSGTMDIVGDSAHDLHVRATIIAVIIVIFGCMFLFYQLISKKKTNKTSTDLDNIEVPDIENDQPTDVTINDGSSDATTTSEPEIITETSSTDSDEQAKPVEAETVVESTTKKESKFKKFFSWLVGMLKQVPMSVWKQLGTKAYDWYKDYSKRKKQKADEKK